MVSRRCQEWITKGQKQKKSQSCGAKSRLKLFRPILETLENRLAPATIVVNSTADTVAVDGMVTLREAILSIDGGSNINSDVVASGTYGSNDTIHFNIPGMGIQSIAMTSALPLISVPMTIDATTQPGFTSSPLVELNGAGTGIGANGFDVTAGAVIRGFVINRFNANGILFSGSGFFDNVSSCYIGTNAAGSAALSNFGNGVLITGPSSIGIATCVISGNGNDGILIQAASGANNLIVGSRIGTNAAGTAAIANNNDGVAIENSSNISFGADLISGNANNGISIVGSGATGNELDDSNLIGTNAADTGALSNGGNGIFINGASGNTIGDPFPTTTESQANVISGNGQNGILIEGPGATGNTIIKNFIGTNLGGSVAIGNGLDGILLENAANNTIGGQAFYNLNFPSNLISGNSGNGVHFQGIVATGNTVTGNAIGTNLNATAAVGNTSNGIFIDGAPGNNINGCTIAGNGNDGILIQGASATANVVNANNIGNNQTSAIPNLSDGIRIDSASNNTIGNQYGGSNQIGGNGGDGVHISGNGASGNVIEGNGIGVAFLNTMIGNRLHGIALEGVGIQNNLIGGTNGTEGNNIRFNAAAGVAIFASPPGSPQNSGNAILANSIFSNGGLGIDLVSKTTYPTDDGVTPNTPGGPHSGPNNLQNFPIVLSAMPTAGGGTTIRGSLNSTPNTTFSIELFASDQPDPSGFGQGQIFLGAAGVITDAQGNGTFMTNAATASPSQFVTATATDPGNNTSEFSKAVHITQPGLAGRVAQNGQWWVATSTGSSFANKLWITWNPNVTWVDVVTGDFNGDGGTDIAGRVLQSGEWWVGISSGSSFTTTRWTTWNPNVTWADVRVGDFTGDGKDDLVGRVAQSGEIWVAMSTGSSFTNSKWTTWNPAATWVDTQVGDFNGDGKADYTSRELGRGAWWTGVSTGSSFTTSPVPWTIWNNQVTWVDVRVGDFNGDGKADLVGRVLQSGEIWVGQSTGTSFTNSLWTTWNAGVTWVDVHIGDFNGDGKADIVGRVLQSGEWWVAQSTGSAFTKSLWDTWNPNVTWVDIQVGDFNGDGKSDITGRVLQSGEWWTGLSTGGSFSTTLWTTWSNSVTWADVRPGDFA